MFALQLAALLLLLSDDAVIAAAAAAKSSSSGVPPVVFPPAENLDGDDGPWSTFALRLGNPEQVVRVLPSTSGYYTVAILPGACNTTANPTACDNARAGIFDPTLSKTWQGEGLFGLGMEANLGYASVNGDFGLDGVGFGVATNPNLTFANQVIAGIVSDEFYLGSFGLGTQPTNFTTFADPHPSFFTALKDANSTPSYTWSYTAGAPYQLTGVLGSLIFGGFDSSRFIPNNVTIPMSPDVSRDLVVGVQSITMTSTSTSNTSLLPSGGIFSFVDSELPYIWLPEDACVAFENAFGLTWNATSELYLVNDTLHAILQASNINITFTLGVGKTGGDTVDITLPYASFDLRATPPLVQNTTSYFPLKRAANSTQYTLGRAFLQEAYLTADYERLNFSLSQCIFESGAQPNIVTIESIATANTSSQASSQASSHSSIGGGAIAGIVIAVVVVVAALSLFLIWMRKKKKLLFKHSTAELSAEDDSNLETESGPQNEEAVNLSPELEGSTMKPLAEAVKMPLVEMEDAGTIDPLSGYFAPKAGQEMEDNTPAAQELSSPDAQIHEMFDESVFRELRADVPASNNRTTHPQTPENGRRFSWVQTPLSAVDGPVLPTYQTHNSEITTIPSDTEQSASYTTEKKEVVEEGPLLHPEGHLSVPIVTPSSRSEQSADLDVPPRVSPSLSEQSTDLEDPPRIAPDRAVSSSTPPEPEGTT